MDTESLGMVDELEELEELGVNRADWYELIKLTRRLRLAVDAEIKAEAFANASAKSKALAATATATVTVTATATTATAMDPAEDLICPISYDVFNDPVTAEDGHVYERRAIEEWYARGHRTSPMTNLPCGTKLTPNVRIEGRARAWRGFTSTSPLRRESLALPT